MEKTTERKESIIMKNSNGTVSAIREMYDAGELTGKEYEYLLSVSAHFAFEKLTPAAKEELLKVEGFRKSHEEFMSVLNEGR